VIALALLLGQGFASLPVPVHGDAFPCADRRIPRTHEGQFVACNSAGQPILRIDPYTRVIMQATALEPLTPPIDLIPPPMLGSAPAVTPHGVAWVVGSRDGRRSLWWRSSNGAAPIVLETGRMDPHHPVTDGRHIAWVSHERITIYDPVSTTREHIDAETGFNSAPAFDRGVVCWEVRGPADVDIACSDGVQVRRDDHQTQPVLVGDHLFFRERGLFWVWDRSP